MFTSFSPSSCNASIAICTFIKHWISVGFCEYNFPVHGFFLSDSTKRTSVMPSRKSSIMSLQCNYFRYLVGINFQRLSFTWSALRCSFIQFVNVFVWIMTHWLRSSILTPYECALDILVDNILPVNSVQHDPHSIVLCVNIYTAFTYLIIYGLQMIKLC